MSSITKQDIIEAIRRTAKENGGLPLGINGFADETGIKPYDWKKFWARFGDAQKEAGFVPNQLQSAYDNNFIIKKMIGLIPKFYRPPRIFSGHLLFRFRLIAQQFHRKRLSRAFPIPIRYF